MGVKQEQLAYKLSRLDLSAMAVDGLQLHATTAPFGGLKQAVCMSSMMVFTHASSMSGPVHPSTSNLTLTVCRCVPTPLVRRLVTWFSLWRMQPKGSSFNGEA